jgi:hypothetical protein
MRMQALASLCACALLVGCQTSSGFIDTYTPTCFVPVCQRGDNSLQNEPLYSAVTKDRRIDANLGRILRCHTKEEVEAILGPATKGVPPGGSTDISGALEIWHWSDDAETFFVGVDAKGQIVDKDSDHPGPCLPPCCYCGGPGCGKPRTFLDRVTDWLGF